MQMIGVADPDGTIQNPPADVVESNSIVETAVKILTIPLILLLLASIPLFVYRGRTEKPLNMYNDAIILDAELVDDGP